MQRKHVLDLGGEILGPRETIENTLLHLIKNGPPRTGGRSSRRRRSSSSLPA
jgi:hypothetical protein